MEGIVLCQEATWSAALQSARGPDSVLAGSECIAAIPHTIKGAFMVVRASMGRGPLLRQFGIWGWVFPWTQSCPSGKLLAVWFRPGIQGDVRQAQELLQERGLLPLRGGRLKDGVVNLRVSRGEERNASFDEDDVVAFASFHGLARRSPHGPGPPAERGN